MANAASSQHAPSAAAGTGSALLDGPPSWLDAAACREACSPDDVPEEIEAGFTRDPLSRYPERGRAGFEAGGPADLMTPSSVLAELTGQSHDRMSELTDDELIGVLCAARRVQSWQAALELEAVSELTSRRLAEPARRGPRPGDRATAEIAAALTLTGRSAELLAHLATTVECLGGVRDALSAGLIDLPRARIFADELCVLDWAPAARIAARVLLDAPGLTTSQLQGRLRRAVLAADPEAGRRRQRRARDKARVQAWQEASGNGALAGRELPPADALAADRHLTALAKSMKAAGAARTLDQLRSAIYLALLSGQDPSVVLAMHAADPDAATSEGAPECADAGGRANGGPGPGGAAAPDDAAGSGAAAAGAAAGSGGAAGSGATASGDAASGDAASSSGAAGSGAAASGDAASVRSHDAASGDPAARPGPTPAWPAGPRGTVHLTMPLSAWLGQTNNPGEVAGHDPLDAWTCRDIARDLGAQPGTQYCLTLTTDEGYAVGHACAGTPPPDPNPAGWPPTDRPPGSTPNEPKLSDFSLSSLPQEFRQWMGGLKFEWLSTGTGCTHARQSGGYQPSAKLGHLVKIRNQTCTAPGCRRSAHGCDLDHLIPYDKGGRTCDCNLHPACRRDHQLKQLPGWGAEMAGDGRVTWFLPHGRAYTTMPEPWPV